MTGSSVIRVVRTALPFILVGGAVGALIGGALGGAAHGFRVGVVVGGALAFIALRRKATDAS